MDIPSSDYGCYNVGFGAVIYGRMAYMAISSGNITDEVVQRYIEDQEGGP